MPEHQIVTALLNIDSDLQNIKWQGKKLQISASPGQGDQYLD